MKVLIVDDHAPARRNLARCLAPLPDIEILEAASLDAARQTLSRALIDVDSAQLGPALASTGP